MCLRFFPRSHESFTGPTSTKSGKINFKTRSHGTIHTFKNYFATMFSVFCNKRYPNRLCISYWPSHNLLILMSFLVLAIAWKFHYPLLNSIITLTIKLCWLICTIWDCAFQFKFIGFQMWLSFKCTSKQLHVMFFCCGLVLKIWNLVFCCL